MKPGDLVQITDRSGYYDYFPPKHGIIIGTGGSWDYPMKVLVEGSLRWCALWELTLVNDGDPSYDIDKETE
jgi:hypothetical protein